MGAKVGLSSFLGSGVPDGSTVATSLITPSYHCPLGVHLNKVPIMGASEMYGI